MYITMDRGTCWSVTCNLKNISRSTVEQHIENAKLSGWGIEGQIEKGEEGTEHFQLMVKTPQVRFSAVKKMFPTAHIELARNRTALAQYVQKEDTRVESIRSVEVSFLTYPMVRKKFFEWVIQEGRSHIHDHDARLQTWDTFIGLSISEGMEVDLIGMNPQHRGCICKYWDSYIARALSLDRQHIVDNSQTDSQSVSVPVIV